MFFDSGYILFVLPALIFAMYAQAKVRSTYARYSMQASRSGLTGGEVAKQMLSAAGLGDVETFGGGNGGVRVEMIGGSLSDNYDPQKKVVRLSQDIYRSNSIAALGIAAHEVGHAVQDGTGYAPLILRSTLVPAAQIGSNLAFPLFFIGLLFRASFLMDAGLLLFGAAVVFTLITLPVEYNASTRAVALLESGGYVDSTELPMVKSVLDAAALTYVAAAAMAIGQFLRLLALRNRRD